MGLGLAIACASVPVAVLIAIYLVTTLTAAIKSEEAFLRRTFGDQYDLYRSGVAAKRRDRAHGAAAVQPVAGDREPRIPRGRRVRRSRCCCSSGRQRIMERFGGRPERRHVQW